MLGQTIMPEITGCDNLYVAKVLTDTADTFLTDSPKFFAPLSELKHDPKAESVVRYYDNAGMFVYPYEGEAADEATISGLSEQDYAEVTGKSYDSATGMIYDSGDPMYSPYYALGYRIQCGAVTKFRWLLKGIFVPGSESIKTKGEKVDPQALTLTYKPVKTIHQWTIKDPRDATKTIKSGLKVVRADTSQPNFAGEDSWFSQVQTPDTPGAPTALAMSSIVPAASATGVLASANVVLTFNNVIASHSIKLINDVTDAIVPAAYSFDSTGKVLTINPTDNMVAGDKHAVAIFGVKDVYGQSLADSLSYFTVAS